MSTKQIKVYSPASIANLGPGFDVFAIALDNLGDTVKVEVIKEQEITVSIQGVEAETIPTDIQSNSASAVIQHVLDLNRLDHGFHIEIRKGVPPGKGLGSSGSSAAAASHAICQLLGLSLSRKELVELAAFGEAAVSGSPHADNVSASLLGGFTIVGKDYDVVRLEPPELEFVVVIPDVRYENKTRLARSLLPQRVTLKDAVLNVGNAAKMVAAIVLKDSFLFGSSICDYLVEPHRAEMIPNFWEVKKAALNANAYGCSIAGGGPSLFAVGKDSKEIGKAMVEAFGDAGIASEIFLTRPSSLGARET